MRARECSGDSAMRSSVSYHSAIRRQSVAAKIGARQGSAHVARAPGGAILFLEQYDGAIESPARVEAGAVEAHQREQGMDRRDDAGRMSGEHPRQPAGLSAQVAADRQVAMRDVSSPD